MIIGENVKDDECQDTSHTRFSERQSHGPRNTGVWSLEPKLKLRNGASGEHGRSQFAPRITSVAVEVVIVCLCQQRDTEEKMKPVILARCNLIN